MSIDITLIVTISMCLNLTSHDSHHCRNFNASELTSHLDSINHPNGVIGIRTILAWHNPLHHGSYFKN